MAEPVQARTRAQKAKPEIVETQTNAGNNFINNLWKPMMAITYMLICIFDFILGPVFYNVLQYLNPGQNVEMWHAVTLQGGGLFHMAMGAILGISAFKKD